MNKMTAWIEQNGLTHEEAAKKLCMEIWRLKLVASGKQKETAWMVQMRRLVGEKSVVSDEKSVASSGACPWCGCMMEQQGVAEQTTVRHPKSKCFMSGKSFNCDLKEWRKWL